MSHSVAHAGSPDAAEVRSLANARLVRAVRGREPAEVEAALAAGADPDACDQDGIPALGMAVWFKSDWSTATKLIEHGACVDISRDGAHLLHRFALENQLSLARMLLNRGQSVDLRTQNQRQVTPLILALTSDAPDMIALLLTYRADVGLRGKYGHPPLHHARSAQTAKQLLAAGADVQTRNDAGQTALIHVAGMGHSDHCTVLLAHGADVNAISGDGNTALLEAAGNCRIDTMALLLDHGADPALGTRFGHDFRYYCEQYEQVALAYAGWRARQAMRQATGERAAPGREGR